MAEDRTASSRSRETSWAERKAAIVELRSLVRGRVRQLLIDSTQTWLVLDDGSLINMPVELAAAAVGGFFREGDHEPLESTFVQSHCKRGTAFIDVGANMGWFTIPASRLVGETGKVLSFEPNPDMFEVLSRNLQKNSCRNVSTYHAAVGRSAGQASLFVPDGRISYGSLRPPDERCEVVPCDVLTLDTTIEADVVVSCIKLDAEGAELDAIAGGQRLIERDHPALCVECVAGQLDRFGATVDQLYEKLRDLGYRVYEFRDGGLAELRHSRDVRPNCALLGLV